MTRPGLRRLYAARSIALVGATERSAWSRLTVQNHENFAFTSRLHLVNGRGGTAFGRAATIDCRSIDDRVDLAYLMVPRSAILETLDDVAAAKIPFALVLASGYAELGEAGRRDQDALVRAARERRITLVGPNCLGYVNRGERTGATPMLSTLPRRYFTGRSGYQADAPADVNAASRPTASAPTNPPAFLLREQADSFI